MPDINDPKRDKDMNPDPITGAPGSHPVGVGIGAAAAGAAGAAIGTAVAGPVGTAVGAAIGAVAGGLTGKGVAEAIDPTAEEAYWREEHRKQPYASHREYDEYAPAYRAGYEGYGRHYREGRTFEDAEADLRREYEERPVPVTDMPSPAQHSKLLPWEEARPAARAAWDRAYLSRERGRGVNPDV